MKYIIIGTAGHVDHGKSALIKALTGTDTDRLKEEKARGISIDLGFATMNLNDEIMTGIVDVPGHERFLKNMLAGTGSIDLAMLVIAADEGVMPQTREHLAMLHFYGIQHGIVVINKIDKVDEEWLELVEEEVGAMLADTFLAGAPLCRVSAITRAGLDELKEKLLTVAREVVMRDGMAPFRLWIDRVFTMKGYGAVVTGSVLSGTANIGDTLTLYPSGQLVRVRGTEFHGQKVEAVYAGQRAALNLVGVSTSEISRGMSLSHEAYGQISTIWDVMVNLEQPIESGTRVRLHLGTGEFLGRVYLFKDSTYHYMRLIVEEPLAASAGDRGIIRLYSPQILLGGIMLIAPCKQARRISENRRLLGQALLEQSVYHIVYGILVENDGLMSDGEIKRQAGYINKNQVNQSLEILRAENKIIMLEQFFIARSSLLALTQKCIELLDAFHRNQPERAGLSREILKQKLGLPDKIFDKVIAYWNKEGTLLSNGGDIALQSHAIKYSDWCNKLLLTCDQVLSDPDFKTIDVAMLGEKLNLLPEKANVVFNMLLSKGLLIQVDTVCIYQKTMQDTIRILKNYFQTHEEITVSQLRTMLNTSRKVALPLLEYFDMNKYTVRIGDVRRPGIKIMDSREG
ncbi:selenocysteine-specific translation elongation factor [Pelosinus sp. sgz500959]|uniref:selenocysteine-specific translation elongation factor n=1 Tax=Pelosinus sp. sgz500959 TaxID=3242472 RepID=UPI00366E1058